MKENLRLEDLLSVDSLPQYPIIAPQEGEIYTFENVLFGIVFDFKIIKEYHDYYEILIEPGTELEKPDVLPKDFEMIEMFNDGIIRRKFEE